MSCGRLPLIVRTSPGMMGSRPSCAIPSEPQRSHRSSHVTARAPCHPPAEANSTHRFTQLEPGIGAGPVPRAGPAPETSLGGGVLQLREAGVDVAERVVAKADDGVERHMVVA